MQHPRPSAGHGAVTLHSACGRVLARVDERLARWVAAALAVVATMLAPTAAWAGTTAHAAQAAPPAGAVASPGLPSIPGDCKGDPPQPGSPYAHLSVKPVITSDKDPFSDPNTSIESAYGTTYRWWAYDNGCDIGSGALPTLGTNLSNTLLEIAGVLPNWGHYLMDSVVDPRPWIGAIDPLVNDITRAVAQSVWTPWLVVVLTLVAIMVLWRARSGLLAGSITAVVWALLVMVVCTWTMSYPSEAVSVVDEGVQTAVVQVATGFSGGAPTPNSVQTEPNQSPWMSPSADAQGRDSALVATDRLYDQLIRNTQYRAWLSGVFGDPDSPTAAKYGPQVFKATHFSFAEYAKYQSDPSGAGKDLIEAKGKDFKKVASKIESEDPVAYQHFTGNKWQDDLATGILNLAVVAAAGLFLLVSAICVLLSYVIIRVAVPLSPAAGILFLMDAFRSQAMAIMHRIAGPVVMGPVFLVVGLLVLRFNAAIASAKGINSVIKLCLILAISLIAWRLLKPLDVVKPKLNVPGWDAMKRYVIWRKGVHDGVRSAAEEADDDDGQSKSQPGDPVYTPAAAAGGSRPYRGGGLYVQPDPNPAFAQAGSAGPFAVSTAPYVAGARPSERLALPAAPDQYVAPQSTPQTFAPRGYRARTEGFTASGYDVEPVEPGHVIVRDRGSADDVGGATRVRPRELGPGDSPTETVTWAPPAPDYAQARAAEIRDPGTPAWKATAGERASRTVHPADADDLRTGSTRVASEMSVSESNVLVDDDGQGVFMVYHPSGSTVYVPDEHGAAGARRSPVPSHAERA